jgi:hypothetical protein
MRLPLCLAGPLALVLLSTPVFGASPCDGDTDTLVRVHVSRDFISRSFRLPPPPLRRNEEYVVTRGGTGVVTRRQELLCCGQAVTKSFAVGAPATPASFQALNQALAESRVGTLASCSIANDLSAPTGTRLLGFYELEWYGSGNRRHAFTVAFADPGGSALPPCGPEVAQLLAAVQAFTDAVLAAPTNRLCGS